MASSVTTTLAQIQMSEAPSVVAVRSQTFWESLSEEEKKKSVNKHRSRQLGINTAWAYSGAVARYWNDEVRPAIKLIINNKENYEKVFRKNKVQLCQPCSLYMIGYGEKRDSSDKPWERARPTIVSICPKRRVAQKLSELLENIDSLKRLNHGFDFMFFEDKKLILAALNDAEGEMMGGLCGGTSIEIDLNEAYGWHSLNPGGTVGGTLRVKTRDSEHSFGITAAHPFYSEDCSDDSDSDASSTSTRSSKRSISPEPFSQTSIHSFKAKTRLGRSANGKINVYTSTMETRQLLGSLPMPAPQGEPEMDKLVCPDLDWALIALEENKASDQANILSLVDGQHIPLSSISYRPLRSSVCIIGGRSGPIFTKGSGVVDGLILPGGRRMIDVWTVESSCFPGDCGSWVVDPESGTVHGMIVATSIDESYLVPIKDIFDSIKSRWPEGTRVELSGQERVRQLALLSLDTPINNWKGLELSKLGRLLLVNYCHMSTIIGPLHYFKAFLFARGLILCVESNSSAGTNDLYGLEMSAQTDKPQLQLVRRFYFENVTLVLEPYWVTQPSIMIDWVGDTGHPGESYFFYFLNRSTRDEWYEVFLEQHQQCVRQDWHSGVETIPRLDSEVTLPEKPSSEPREAYAKFSLQTMPLNGVVSGDLAYIGASGSKGKSILLPYEASAGIGGSPTLGTRTSFKFVADHPAELPADDLYSLHTGRVTDIFKHVPVVKTEPCSFFRQGKCLNGDDCESRHDLATRQKDSLLDWYSITDPSQRTLADVPLSDSYVEEYGKVGTTPWKTEQDEEDTTFDDLYDFPIYEQSSISDRDEEDENENALPHKQMQSTRHPSLFRSIVDFPKPYTKQQHSTKSKFMFKQEPDRDQAIALHAFDGERAGDLTFKQGDLINILTRTQSKEDWWTGETEDGRVGAFPSNYIDHRNDGFEGKRRSRDNFR